MLLKQFVYGRSKAVISILFLVSSASLFCGGGMSTPERDSLPPVAKEEPPSSSSAAASAAQASNYFHGKSIEELTAVFEAAPWKAREIVDHLKDPRALAEPEYRAAFFVGVPGTGKTTMAIAIPYFAGWQCNFIRSSELQRSHRNRATEELLRELHGVRNGIRRSGERVVVVVDELNKLLEHSNDPHYDTDASSGAIQGFLDDIEGEDRFFFIGTMNDDTRMPESMKNRIELDRVVFSLITDPTLLRRIFRSKLVTPRMKFHEECDDEFIDAIIALTRDCPQRSYKNMRKELSRLLRHEEPDNALRLIKRAHLTAVSEALLQARRDIRVGYEEETEAQRQERLHEDSMEQQRRLQEESLRQQRQLQEANLRQQRIQAERQHYRESLRRSNRAIGRFVLDHSYPEEKKPEWMYRANDEGCTIQ